MTLTDDQLKAIFTELVDTLTPTQITEISLCVHDALLDLAVEGYENPTLDQLTAAANEYSQDRWNGVLTQYEVVIGCNALREQGYLELPR